MYMYRAIYMLVFDSSLRRHEFVSETVRRKFVVNTVAPRPFAVRVLRFPPVSHSTNSPYSLRLNNAITWGERGRNQRHVLQSSVLF